MRNSHEKEAANHLDRALERIGPSDAVRRFLAKYGPVRTRAGYASQLLYYFEWLRREGVSLSPDQLIQDNIEKVLKSDPTDIRSRRHHTDLLLRYVNEHMKAEGYSQRSRIFAATVVRRFYLRNDAQLWGDFEVAFERPNSLKKAIPIDDIRAVLRHLPPHIRLPFLLQLQGGLEIDKVLSLRWGDVLPGLQGGERPLKVTFSGRKRMIRPYFTFLGRDACELLNAYLPRWREFLGREPEASDIVLMGKQRVPIDGKYLNQALKKAVRHLADAGQLSNTDPAHWSSHIFRKAFRTECSHAKVPLDTAEFWLGHERGVVAVYDRSDELHEGDFREEYRRLEPYVSLDENATTLKDEYEAREREIRSEFDGLRSDFQRLQARFLAAETARSSSR
ncbi:MAG: tyrosine-type recombinase/integrase [Nitrososphaerota archaeon]|nr:tyrosine-type recombinase/integrase [Nitrososphaerota archaeon]